MRRVLSLLVGPAVLLGALVMPGLVRPCLADEPARPPTPSRVKLDEDRGPVHGPTVPLDEDRGSLTGALPGPPQLPPPAPAPAPPGYAPAPPPGYAPAPGYGPAQGYRPAPGYAPAPSPQAPYSGYPPQAYQAPGYSYPNAYYPNSGMMPGPGPIDPRTGAPAGQPLYGERDVFADYAATRPMRRTSTGLIIAGVASVGVGWLGASLHGLVMSLVEDGLYRAIYIPVVGPIVEAATHETPFRRGEEIGLAFESVVQITGAAAFVVGLALRPGKIQRSSSPVALNFGATPTDRGLALGLTGTF